MRRFLSALALIALLPGWAVACYLHLPDVKEQVDRWYRRTFPQPPPQDTVIRYLDREGRKFYVSSLDAVPPEYRGHVEVNPALPSVNRGEYQPPATPTPSPIPVKRGGDGIIEDSGKEERKSDSLDFDEDGFEKSPHKAFEQITELLEGGPK